MLLDVWEVSSFTGEPHGAEGQPLAWASERELLDYEFPAANQPIVAAARLPDTYLITPEGLEPAEMLRGVRAALAAGARLIQLRAPNMFDPQYRDLAVDIQGLCAGKAQLMLKGPLEWLGDFPAAGWHLTAAQLRKYAPQGRPFPGQRWLAASCHDAEELALAARRQRPGIRVLLMSGYSEQAVAVGLPADCALLEKPFLKPDLARAVRRTLDRPPTGPAADD